MDQEKVTEKESGMAGASKEKKQPGARTNAKRRAADAKRSRPQERHSGRVVEGSGQNKAAGQNNEKRTSTEHKQNTKAKQELGGKRPVRRKRPVGQNGQEHTEEAKKEPKIKTSHKKVDEAPKPDLEHDSAYLFDGEGENGEEAGLKGKAKKKKALMILGSVLAALVVIYLGISAFFINHFYYGTTINGVKFSMKSASAVENYFEKEVKNYTLTIDEKNDVKETISGADISLEYKKNDEIKKALKKQNPLLWPTVFFKPSAAEVKVDVSYDQATLQEKVQALQCIADVEQIESESAKPAFDGNEFVVEAEKVGTKVNQDVLQEKVEEYISGFKSELNMEEEGCYSLPKYTSDSPEVQAACDTLNEYCKASITYTMGSQTEVVDKTLISGWLSCDENLNVTFNTDAVTQYMAEFGKKYDTVGTTRSITTPGGKVTQVTGGTYGWSVDEATEAQALIDSIQKGETVTKEPAYTQTAASHDGGDWGTTYIEVDLTAQHMWYVSNGAVAFETDVVTGVPTPQRQTPEGVYSILEKLRNKTLRGEKKADGTYEYETPVSYWMRVTYTGVGFHDATWQPYFGGTRYINNGSHGCINMSYNDAGTLYDLISVGEPVVIHY